MKKFRVIASGPSWVGPCPSNALAPRTSEHGPVWRKGLYRGRSVKMRLTSPNVMGVLINSRKMDQDAPHRKDAEVAGKPGQTCGQMRLTARGRAHFRIPASRTEATNVCSRSSVCGKSSQKIIWINWKFNMSINCIKINNCNEIIT